MSLFREIESLKSEIVDTEQIYALSKEHPLMSIGLKERLEHLKSKMESMPKESFEPKIQLLFSGGAVIGSQGIKSSFVSKALNPLQEMIKTQTALVRFGNVSKRGRQKKSKKAELYLTSLPIGSFGIELSQLESDDLLEAHDVSVAMKQVMDIVQNSCLGDDQFESMIENTPRRNLSNLKTFLEEVKNENSVIKMESGKRDLRCQKSVLRRHFQGYLLLK